MPAHFSDNPLCQLLGIQYPIVQAGMVWVSGWRLASAAANAGVLGLIGAGSMDALLLKQHIDKCKQATKGVFGVNIPLLYPHTAEVIDLCVQEKVKVVVTSAGNPKTWTSKLKDAGILVIHVCGTARFAEKAHLADVDAIVCEGTEAGGHNSREEITTLCLIPQAREVTSKPLIAAGGIATGAGIAAVMALGADGAQLGTRFALTQESSAHPAYKQAGIDAGEQDTTLALRKLVPIRMLKNQLYEQIAAMEGQGATKEQLADLMGKGRSRKGIFEGDLENGELEIGQICGAIADLPTVEALVPQLLAEYLMACQRLLGADSSSAT